MLRLRMMALAAMAALASAAPVSADTNALTVLDSANVSNGFTGTYGWEFSVNQTITVTQLGVYDNNSTLLANHEVAVFDTSGKVYALGTVQPIVQPVRFPDQTNYFTYAPVTFSSPLVPLAPGADYIIGTFLSGGDYSVSDDGFTPITVNTASEINFVGDRSDPSSTTLTFPTDTSDPALQPVYSYFGPSFQFVDGSFPVNAPNGPLPGLPGQGGPGTGTTIPEPGAAALLALGLPVLLAVTRRRKTGPVAA